MSHTKIALANWTFAYLEVTIDTTPAEIMDWIENFPESQGPAIATDTWKLIANYGPRLCKETDTDEGYSFFLVAEKKHPRSVSTKVVIHAYSREEFDIEFTDANEQETAIFSDEGLYRVAKGESKYPTPPDDGECITDPSQTDDDNDSKPKPPSIPEDSPVANAGATTSAPMSVSNGVTNTVSMKPNFTPNIGLGNVELNGRYVDAPAVTIPDGKGMDDISKNILKNMSKQLGSMRGR